MPHLDYARDIVLQPSFPSGKVEEARRGAMSQSRDDCHEIVTTRSDRVDGSSDDQPAAFRRPGEPPSADLNPERRCSDVALHVPVQ